MPPVDLGDVMRAATVGVVELGNDAFPAGTNVLGFGGLSEYYEGIVGVNVFYMAGDCNGLP
jgi:NADPH-dependent curcumin reductase CurA